MSDIRELSDEELIKHILESNAKKKRQCDEDTCRHFAGYEDINGVEWCQCHWVGEEQNWPDGVHCKGQPKPGLGYYERVSKDFLEWFERIDS